VEAYKQYKSLGPAKADNARWVVYEAVMYFDKSLLMTAAGEVDDADVAWIQALGVL
jgi:hypothetical protein